MNSLVLSIGSNSKDREWQVKNCITWLKGNLDGVTTSYIYNTKADNGVAPDYLTAEMKAKCREELPEITGMLKKYETVCGRTPMSKKKGDIPMDLDIIIWNDEIIREADYNQPYFQIDWQQHNEK